MARFIIRFIILSVLCGLSIGVTAQRIPPEAGIWDVEWSPDGSMFATANPDGQINVYDVKGTLLRTFSGHLDRAVTVAWSPDGTVLASGGWDPYIRFWDVQTGTLIEKIFAFDEYVSVLDWQAHGNYLLAAGFDRFRIWDAKTFLPLGTNRDGTFYDLKWSPNDESLALSGLESVGVATLQNAEMSGRRLEDNDVVSGSPAVNWNSDGTKLVGAGRYDGSIRIWDAGSGELKHIFFGVEGQVTDTLFIGDEKIAVITNHGNLYVMDATSGEILAAHHDEAIYRSMAWNDKSGRLVIVGSTGPALAEDAIVTDPEATGFLSILTLASLMNGEALKEARGD